MCARLDQLSQRPARHAKVLWVPGSRLSRGHRLLILGETVAEDRVMIVSHGHAQALTIRCGGAEGGVDQRPCFLLAPTSDRQRERPKGGSGLPIAALTVLTSSITEAAASNSPAKTCTTADESSARGSPLSAPASRVIMT